MMKRISNVYQKIASVDNLNLADKKARKRKGDQYGIRLHDKNREQNICDLHRQLVDRQYRTSTYSTFQVFEPKVREVYRLPFFPDRITHHAIMNVLEPVFVSTFTKDTYSCIKGRGIHGAAAAVKRSLQDVEGSQYCLKMDIRKFYPSIDHETLKQLLRRKFKDHDLLWLLDEIIDSAPGVPIGNYLSQYFANFYLSYFDHWLKEVKGVKHYFRYADDLVILSSNKISLHELLSDIRQYLDYELKLEIKNNYQIFPVADRGIDFVGYRFFHTHTLLRKGIKKNLCKMLKRNRNDKSISSYRGWIMHCNSHNLQKRLVA